MIGTPIKFAGLLSHWQYTNAKEYADKLHEMGFFAKILKMDTSFVVAYSYRTFNREECEIALEEIFSTENGRGKDESA